jgi:phospholipid N-methyltransferase
MTTRKKKKIDIVAYRKLLCENEISKGLAKTLKEQIIFPIENFLEIGTGTTDFMTKHFIIEERNKNISKFYAMEPVDEYFEESKRHVVRLSRTDAITQEYYGGNPFDFVFSAFVLNHVYPDQKLKFLKNVRENLKRNGTFMLVDSLIPTYKNEDDRKQKVLDHYKLQADYAKKSKQDCLIKYFDSIVNKSCDDVWLGNYKISVEDMRSLLEKARFKNIQIQLFEGKDKYDWKGLGYYIIRASN